MAFSLVIMPKVVRVITRLNIGGPAQHVISLTTHLHARGYLTTLVTGRVDGHEGDLGDLAVRNDVSPVVVPTLRNRSSVLADLHALVHLWRIFRRERPMIAHLHLLKARALGAVAARLAGVPVVVETLHGTLFSEYYRPLVSRFLLFGERWLARMMDAIIAVSEEVAAEVVRLGLAPADKVHVISLGLELTRFIGQADGPGALRAELGIPDTTPLIGSVGRLVPIKGLSYLIKAAPFVLRAAPKAHFVFVGDGTERPVLERQVHQAGLAAQTHFLGWRKDVELIYPDLDIVVLSSLNEGTPVAIIEAMAAGRAVVATHVGGVPDIVLDGETGVLVPPKDPEALADAIVKLLADANLRRRLGVAAREAVHPRYAVGRLVEDMDIFYRQLFARKGISMGRER